MRCPPEIAVIIGKILSIGLLRIRSLGWNLNGERCAVEADHLHNLPTLFTDYKPELLDYYWRVERIVFMQHSSKEDASGFEQLWDALGEHLPSGKNAVVHQ